METSIILVSEKLDNPVWSSLSENHDKFCLNFGKVKFYNPEYCPFGAFVDQNISTDAMEEYSHQSNNFFVVGNKPTELPQNLELKNELVCNQMIIETPITIEFTEDVVLLNEKFQRELIELVNLVQPGFFKEKTVQLGNYYGIFKQNKLVAVTGERMKMKDATEVSAVVTHPEYLGNGYAKQLVAFVTNSIFKEKKQPFLHVAASNSGAINLYEKLGYVTSRKISFWNYCRK